MGPMLGAESPFSARDRNGISVSEGGGTVVLEVYRTGFTIKQKGVAGPDTNEIIYYPGEMVWQKLQQFPGKGQVTILREEGRGAKTIIVRLPADFCRNMRVSQRSSPGTVSRFS